MRNKYFYLVFFTLTLFVMQWSYAGGGNAFVLYKKALYEDAYFSFKNLAQVGDNSAQYMLGVMHYRGEYVEKDAVEAYAWMKLATESGDEHYLKTSQKLYAALSPKKQSTASNRFDSLALQYSRSVLTSSLAPQPLSDADCEPEPEPQKVVYPKYPRRAGVTPGYVDLSFNISGQGYARDISIREKTHDMFMAPSALAALKSRWPAKIVNGVAVLRPNTYYRYSYTGLAGADYSIVKTEEAAIEALADAEKGLPEAQFKFAKTLASLKNFRVASQKFDLEYKAANEWFLKAAASGHPLAQYELGKNMLLGRGCSVDKVTGIKWLRAAAASGHYLAQEELAMSGILHGLSDERQAVYWLRKAVVADHYKAKLILAWQLSTSIDVEIRDGKEALKLLEPKPKLYFDEVRILETYAAAYAETGDFSNAVKYQKKAIKKARKLNWVIPIMHKRLESYKIEKYWRGYYHAAN